MYLTNPRGTMTTKMFLTFLSKNVSRLSMKLPYNTIYKFLKFLEVRNGLRKTRTKYSEVEKLL